MVGCTELYFYLRYSVCAATAITLMLSKCCNFVGIVMLCRRFRRVIGKGGCGVVVLFIYGHFFAVCIINLLLSVDIHRRLCHRLFTVISHSIRAAVTANASHFAVA